eukprot:IDg11386t1
MPSSKVQIVAVILLLLTIEIRATQETAPCKPNEEKSVSCCKEKTYNEETHTCCDGVVRKGGKNEMRCCRDAVFDPQTHMCCSGVVQKGPYSVYSMCCGTKRYDTRTHRCCGGVHVYDAATHFCCASRLFEGTYPMKQCCGYNAYEPASRVCCNGKTFARALFGAQYAACCGF